MFRPGTTSKLKRYIVTSLGLSLLRNHRLFRAKHIFLDFAGQKSEVRIHHCLEMAGLTVGPTGGTDPRKVLENACRLCAFVASHHGATPLFPQEIKDLFREDGRSTPPSPGLPPPTRDTAGQVGGWQGSTRFITRCLGNKARHAVCHPEHSEGPLTG
jgi:hypothetical protein